MRIVLIDDEVIIVNGIKSIISRIRENRDEIYAFSDFCEMLAFVQKNPCDLLITDICMEEKDGFSVIEQVKATGNCKRFAIVSGYSHFAYAKKSIEVGVIDYLLKPIDENEMLKLIQNVENDMQREMTEGSVALLKDYIDGHISYQKLISYENLQIKALESKRVRVVKCMQKNSGKLFDSLQQNYDRVFKLEAIHSDYYLIFSGEVLKNELGSLLASLTPNFCLVSEEFSLKEIAEGYQQCKRGAIFRPFFKDKEILFWTEINNGHSGFARQTKMENEFYLALKGKNQKNAKQHLLKLLNDPACRESLRFLEEFSLHLNDMLKNKSEKIRFHEYADCETLADKIMSGIYTGKRVEKITESILLNNALEYIELNYCKAITLATVANEISVNYYYLSRLFREQMKLNFKQYITQKRLAHAVKLLKSPSLKIYEVAQLCGYENVNTFNEAFKEHYSITPTEYKTRNFE